MSDCFRSSGIAPYALTRRQFNQKVRVKGLSITSSVQEQAPKEIRLFINQPSLGFDNAETAGPSEIVQTVFLSEDNTSLGQRVDLRFVKFQNVESIHVSGLDSGLAHLIYQATNTKLFVVNNQGQAETTRIDSIDFFGDAHG